MAGEMRLALAPAFSGPVEDLTPVAARRTGDAAVQTWRMRAEGLRGQMLFIAGVLALVAVLQRIRVRWPLPYGDWAQPCSMVRLLQLAPRMVTHMPWHISGEYMETCNCSFICPCISSNLSARPTEGDCKAAIAMRIDRGEKDGISLSGLSFIVVLHAPGAMAEGNIKVGLIVDGQSDEAQTTAITEIATGAAGGPMAALGPLVGAFAGVEKRPITFEMNGLERRVSAGELVQQSLSGVPSAVREGEPIHLDNTAHPANAKLALARATTSRFQAFGIDWEDATGSRNGHFAPFAWQG